MCVLLHAPHRLFVALLVVRLVARLLLTALLVRLLLTPHAAGRVH